MKQRPARFLRKDIPAGGALDGAASLSCSGGRVASRVGGVGELPIAGPEKLFSSRRRARSQGLAPSVAAACGRFSCGFSRKAARFLMFPALVPAAHPAYFVTRTCPEIHMTAASRNLSHLKALESESIEIFREVAASFERPVMMYSIGKDSSVLLHLARKAFFPSRIPFPLLHVDTTWKFHEMIAFRDRMAEEHGFELIVHTNPDGVANNINPFDHGSSRYTDIMKTQALRQALDAGKYDAAIGGARRDEEKSRAKERIFSHRNSQHAWDPKNQRPELWRIFNTRLAPGESMRVFPLSNWTELDIWTYIYSEGIEIVPLYFARPRPVVERLGTLIMVDDDRYPLLDGETPREELVRFRTLGCYPLTGAIRSNASDLPSIIMEMQASRTSEREGRLIDSDQAGSMEKKKQEGYF
jgi:sulfate adenylyltransferase subunit 2